MKDLSISLIIIILKKKIFLINPYGREELENFKK